MISPELLRHFPFFGNLSEAQLREVAMIVTENVFEPGAVIFVENDPADTLYFLVEGSIDLYYRLPEESASQAPPDIHVGAINPGEPFGISALIKPHVLTSSARVSTPSRVITIRAADLFPLFEQDTQMAFLLTHQATKAAMQRLHATRVQLAAARA